MRRFVARERAVLARRVRLRRPAPRRHARDHRPHRAAHPRRAGRRPCARSGTRGSSSPRTSATTPRSCSPADSTPSGPTTSTTSSTCCSTGERDGYYDEYEPSLAQLARCIDRGFFYEGQPWRPTGKPRGAPADAMPATAFVYCLQNHDQVGNRALGERLHHIAPRDLYCAMTALLLFLPTTPLLWMGQEWGAEHAVAVLHRPPAGARQAGHRGSPRRVQGVRRVRRPGDAGADPRPAGRRRRSATRSCSGTSASASPHRELLALHKALLELRRDDPVLRVPDRHRTSVGTDGLHSMWVRRWTLARPAPAGRSTSASAPS